MHHLKQNSHQTNKPARFLQNGCLYALKLPLINYHAKKQRVRCLQLHNYRKSIHRMYMYLLICKLIQFFYTFKMCVLFYFIKNKIQLIIPMVLRENVISVCYLFLKSNIDYQNELKNVNKHYVLQHQFFQPAMHALFRNRCVFSISCTCINC